LSRPGVRSMAVSAAPISRRPLLDGRCRTSPGTGGLDGGGDVGQVVMVVLLVSGVNAAAEWAQRAARTPRALLSEAMIVPPTVTARNDRAKLVWKNLWRSQARVSSSAATTLIAALIAAL
jgi:hypothetical protein